MDSILLLDLKKHNKKNTINILALDQASKCGYCVSEEVYGTWDFSTRKDESAGMKWLRFKAKLKETVDLLGIHVVSYERVAGQHKNAIIHSAKMVAIIESFCEENSIEYRAFSATEIKKFATGKGNAGKSMMIQAAKDKYGYEGNDDNEADAIHIYYLTKDSLNIK